MKQVRGNVRFIFQHAEEPIPGGAIDFVNSGKLDNIRAVFGLHADPEIPVGHIGLRSGWINAQSNRIKFKISGPGGHSSRVHQAPDPVYIGMSMLNLLYSSLSRLQNPEKPFIFSIGIINSGNSYNSIASSFEAEGTLRVTDIDYGDHVIKIISDNVKKITSLFEVSAKFDVTRGAPPVINDTELTVKVKKILESALISDSIVGHPRSFGGEDFSSFLSKAPGLFLRFGVINGHVNAKLHTGNFDIDEGAIPFGITTYSWILMKMLGQFQNTN
jgi:amidohydrolase